MKMLPISLAAVVLSWLVAPAITRGEDPKNDPAITIAEGKLVLTAPDKWVRKQPKTRIVDHEFAIPAVEGDQADGRLTVMGAGGAVEDNIARWVGQFEQPDKKDVKKEKKTIAGNEVYLVDISGTYKETAGGPFSGGKVVEKPDYRMLAAIITTEKDGNYFVKLYGPSKTIAANEAAFMKMVDGLKKK
ncbi:MAG TPA: hypothetical protein VFE24_16415 [Pirellulales bacterium]|jgi:hypothetical protein|nr:hypothetical protein [Pirellulales bacterium]